MKIKEAPPLVPAHGGPGHRAFYAADFKIPNDRTIEIILFADSNGNLDYIEVDCCANSYPIPDLIEVGEPFHTWAATRLLS